MVTLSSIRGPQSTAICNDLVMRSWSKHEPEVAEIVSSVDRNRFDIVHVQFRRLGYKGDDLDIRTRSFFVTTSLWTVINRRASRKERLHHLEGVLELLLASAMRYPSGPKILRPTSRLSKPGRFGDEVFDV